MRVRLEHLRLTVTIERIRHNKQKAKKRNNLLLVYHDFDPCVGMHWVTDAVHVCGEEQRPSLELVLQDLFGSGEQVYFFYRERSASSCSGVVISIPA